MARRISMSDLLLAELLRQKLQNVMDSDSDSSDSDTFTVSSSRPQTARTIPVTVETSKQDYVVVVAVDFGTTYSGYACSFKGKEDKIQMNKNWGSSGGFASYKTPTSVLVDPDFRFVAFGYEAQTKYAAMKIEEAQQYYYFERFKMILHHTKDMTRDTQVNAANGKTFAALAVFSMALRYLKEHFVEAMEKSVDCKPDSSMVRWVVTVPAIWTDSSKSFMREAAVKAGIIGHISSTNLVIALEPEAASLHCRGLDIKQFVGATGSLELNAGTKYLVVDAGGGTLDVTAHEVVSDGCVKELHHATGGDHGGIKVDAEYVDLLHDIFGKKFIDTFKRDNPWQWLSMLTEFEKKKRDVSPESDASTNLTMPWVFGCKYAEMMKKGVETAFDPCSRAGVTFNSGMICVSAPVMRQLFGSVLHRIVGHMRDLLSIAQLQGVKYMFVVGGFGECLLLNNALKLEFGGKIRILVPEEASLAVIRGAIKFGHNPQAVSSRICPRTYGFRRCPAFQPGVHDSRRKKSINGVERCEGVFHIIVSKGDELEVNAFKTHEVKPVSPDQSSASITFFTSDQSDVCYVDEEGVQTLCKVQVTWPGSGMDRKLILRMTFGDTELDIKATAFPLGITTSTKVDFLH